MSSDPNYTPVNWALTGVAGALTVGRYAIRAYSSRRFYWDDLAHLFGLVVLIAHGVTNELSLDSKAHLNAAAKARPQPSEHEMLGFYQYNQRLSTVNNCFLYLVFWIVKLSFLLFYYLLFQTSAAFKKAWWVILVFTLLTFWVPIAGVLATCAGANTVAAYKACSSASQARVARLAYSGAVNIVSDLAIMALPFWMLRGLSIGTKQKIGLGFIFSLATVCVVLDIVRVIQAAAQHQALYTIIEINFVVIISCLPTYRALLGVKKRRQSRRPSGSYPWRSIDAQSHSAYADNRALKTESDDGQIHVTRELTVLNTERDHYQLDPEQASQQPTRAVSSPRMQTRFLHGI